MCCWPLSVARARTQGAMSLPVPGCAPRQECRSEDRGSRVNVKHSLSIEQVSRTQDGEEYHDRNLARRGTISRPKLGKVARGDLLHRLVAEARVAAGGGLSKVVSYLEWKDAEWTSH